MQLQIPNLPPDFEQLFAITPVQLFQAQDITQVTPYLQQLMCADLTQLAQPSFVDKLHQTTQLLQLSLQYFVKAQDHYADQLEHTLAQLSEKDAQIKLLQAELQRRPDPKQQQPTPAFVMQMRSIIEANKLLLDENTRLKQQMTNIAPVAQANVFRCGECEKKFATHDFLAEHIHRRHGGAAVHKIGAKVAPTFTGPTTQQMEMSIDFEDLQQQLEAVKKMMM